jgi:hypothetical protein
LRRQQSVPRKNVTSKQDEPQARRRWHTWRATTSIALLEALGDEAGAGQDKQNICDKTIKSLEDILKPFAGSEHNNFATDLRDIVHKAMELDKLMSKQASAFKWIHKLDELPNEYSPDQMEFDPENAVEMPKREDCLVVLPGLSKRGRSTGQDFDQVTFLFKTKLLDVSKKRTNKS